MKKIHIFHFQNENIVIDVNSGAIHVVDNLTCDILKVYNGENESFVYNHLLSKYSKDSIKEVFKELQLLKENSLLFTSLDDLPLENISETPVIKAMCIHLAHSCNLACKYCFADKEYYLNHGSLLMSKETARKTVDFLVKHSKERVNCDIDFFGGEPLLNVDVFYDIVTYLRKNEKAWHKKFHLTLTTNSLAIDDKLIAFIEENDISLIMSLDGRESVHNFMRPHINGKDSFKEIFTNIKKVITKIPNLNYFVRGTYTANNLDFSNDALFLWENGIKKISLEPVVGDNFVYAIRKEHLPTLFIEYEKLAMLYLKEKNKDHAIEFFHFNLDLNNTPCIGKYLRGCSVGGEYLAVNTIGELFPCHQFVAEKSFLLGNIKEGISRQGELLRKEFYTTTVLNKKECTECWAKYYCGGGCHANAYFNNKGNLTKPYFISCELQKKRLECAIGIDVMQKIQKGV